MSRSHPRCKTILAVLAPFVIASNCGAQADVPDWVVFPGDKWDRDLKDVLDERLFGHLDIPPDRWDWLPGEVVHDTKGFYPDLPNYGEYVGPPYKINTKGFPFGRKVAAQGSFPFPVELIVGPVDLKRGHGSQPTPQ